MKQFVIFLIVSIVTIIPVSAQYPGNVGTEIQIWLKADAGVLNKTLAVAANGDSVSRWQDKSGVRINHANATNNSTAKPTYQNNANSHINYHPVLEFNGSTTGLSYGNDYPFVSSDKNGVTYFAVVKPDLTTAKPKQFIYDFGHLTTLGYGMYLSDDNYGFYTPNSELQQTRTENSYPVMVHQDIRFNSYRTLYLNGSSTPAIHSTSAPAVLDTSNINEAPSGGAIQGPFTIGRQSKVANITNGNGRYFQGKIAEVIGYSTSLSGTDLQKVKSYLAIKYGFALDVNFLNSAGTVVYDVSSCGAGVIGLMRDDASGLMQKQSIQPDTLTRIYISTLAATQAGNAGTISTDAQSLIIGHNNQGLMSYGSTEYPTGQGIFSRLHREWKITNTSFDQSFSMDVVLPGSIDISHLRVLIDDDGNFSNAQIFSPAIFYSNGYVTISGIDHTLVPQNSTRYMTIASLNGATPLPIQWLGFEVEKRDDGNLLAWEVTDGNNIQYDIQRSENAKDWKNIISIEQIIGAQYYSYMDKSPLSGVNYYRIKQTDADGTFSYSEIKKADHSGISIYPNPASSEITVEVNFSGITRIRVINITGLVLKEMQTDPENGKQYSMDVSALDAGMYFVWADGAVYRFEKR